MSAAIGFPVVCANLRMDAVVKTKTLITTGTVAAIVVGAAAILPTAWHSPASAAIPPEPPATSAAAVPVSSPAIQGLPDFSPLVERYGPAVVNITVKQEMKTAAHPSLPPGFDEDSPFAPFFRGLPMPPHQPMMGEGSGFIVAANGVILTNAHVVDDASEVTVKLTDKREFTAKVLGKDAQTDVAVLKIEASGLPVVQTRRPGPAEGRPVGARHRLAIRLREHRHRRYRRAPRAGRCPTRPTSRSSRRTSPSIRAIPAGRCSTSRARLSASTRRSSAAPAATRASPLPSPSTSRCASRRISSPAATSPAAGSAWVSRA